MSDPGAAATAYSQFPITTTTEFLEWGTERSVGLVYGLVVNSLGSAAKFTAGLKTAGGAGQVEQYTKVLEDARRQALGRMIENARLLGANAVLGFRFESSTVGAYLTEIVAYGTGVVLGPKR